MGLTAGPRSPLTHLLQVFYQQVPFRTGTRDTSFIFSLVVANATYHTSPPLTERRFEDLYYVSYNTVQVSHPAQSTPPAHGRAGHATRTAAYLPRTQPSASLH